jgi:anti-anti-sigma factor
MEIHEQRHGAVLVLKPQGALVADDAAMFRQRVLNALGPTLGRVVVDTTAIPYADSAGLEALLDITEDLARSGQALKLCGVNETLREVLELTDLASQFDHFEDVHTAVRSFL